jgi:hypothetical protein
LYRFLESYPAGTGWPDEFNTNTPYAVGSYVFKDYNVYRFTSAHAAGAWNANEVVRAIRGIDIATELSAQRNNSGAQFDSANHYLPGNLVMHANYMYKFILEHNAGDPWNENEVASIGVSDALNEIWAAIHQLQNP